MDKQTKSKTLGQLATSAAEIAAELAATLAESAGASVVGRFRDAGPAADNEVLGAMLPAFDQLATISKLLEAARALHRVEAI